LNRPSEAVLRLEAMAACAPVKGVKGHPEAAPLSTSGGCGFLEAATKV